MNEKEIILLFGNFHHIRNSLKKNIKIHNIVVARNVPDLLKHENVVNHLIEDIDEVENTIIDLMNRFNINSIISFTDKNQGVFLANFFSNKYSLFSDNLDAIKFFNDKNKTRELLKMHDLNSVKFIKSRNPDEIFNFIENYKKVVVKPITGQGSKDVYKVDNKTKSDDLKCLLNFNKEMYLIEEFIEGDEFSVEVASFNGEHKVLGITRKFLSGLKKYPFVERGHIFPALLKNSDMEYINRYIIEFLKLSGIRNGISHNEIKLKNGIPILIESQLRPGGDLIPRLIELTKGIDIHELAIEIYTDEGRLFSLLEKEDTELHAGIVYLFPNTGKVRDDVELPSNNLELDKFIVNIKKGDVIEEITCTDDRKYGYLVGVDNDYNKLKVSLDQLLVQIYNNIKYI
ncbi:ATP-grasp domain-containing protein [Virgibacillus doumboii]|uniref:ATP-grasp domain-containing protein n=1 Tax=Virgibacillus doumboii TaxID=2697503 RepID=UPI0013E0168D|nr:ATP-grasp domain-containing protein [Virgibacillus doumboii]